MRMRGRAKLAVVLWTLTLAPPSESRAGAGEHLLAGCEALYRGRWRQAEEHFATALGEDNTCAEAMVGQAAALLQRGRPDEAATGFRRAVALAEQMPAAHAGLAACHYLNDDPYQAMIEYRRALGHAGSGRAQLRASAAWLACRLGLYESALAEAAAAAAEEPDDPLARHVHGAALLALGRADEAVRALGRPVAATHEARPGLLAVASALLSPGAAYWAEHELDDELRLAELPQYRMGQEAPVSAPPPEDEPPTQVEVPPTQSTPGFSISRPRTGAIASGVIEVAVESDGTLPISHIAVLLDDRFSAISNARPFRASVDTRGAKDGLREIRVEGYSLQGQVLATATVTVQVSNGSRTLAPEERSARRVARRELAALLSLRATPLTNAHLLGRALEEAGRSAEAVAAYEYVFGHDPLLPGIRTDLLLGYRAMGLRPLDGSREIYLLSEPNAVALTFDDGPHPVMTPWILDLLERYHYRATFFVVGKQVAMYPGLVRQIAERGHELGSHSHTHCNLCTLSRLGVEQELVRSRAAIRQACGRTVTLFRPPGGHYDETVRRAAAATGFSSVFWNENIGNYPGAQGPAIAESMDRKLAEGGIVLLHNGYDETEVALPHLLRRLHARGVRCDTVSALAAG